MVKRGDVYYADLSPWSVASKGEYGLFSSFKMILVIDSVQL